jgi:uncharacterized membrane protein YeaQ/YmgE (transglycosylase-associated protein family)
MAILLLIALILLILATVVIRTVIGLVLMLVLAALIGAVAQSLIEYKRGGIGTTLLIGLAGAAIGAIGARILGLPLLLVIERLPLIWSFVGSFVLVAALKVVAPEERRDEISGGRQRRLPPDV